MKSACFALVASMTLLACGSDDDPAPGAGAGGSVAGAGGAGGSAGSAGGAGGSDAGQAGAAGEGAAAGQGGSAAGDGGSAGEAGQGGAGGESGGSGQAGQGGSGVAPTTEGAFDPEPFGGDRPVKLYVPKGYVPGEALPLVILLHGYGASGSLQELLFNLEKSADEKRFLYMYPDGTKDSTGKRFWNATDACCGFGVAQVDDVGYLNGLIDEVKGRYQVDAKRVFLAGHSNGGFMSYHMACKSSDRIAGIVSLAGATFADATQCQPSSPVSVLQVHGTKDDTIVYEGGTILGFPYPSAKDTVAQWAVNDGCNASPEPAGTIDVENSIPGEESDIVRYSGCQAGTSVELWTINGGVHIPNVSTQFRLGLVDFLLAHPKP